MQQQTAVTEILNHCKELISEGHEIDTQGLVHWIEDKLLEMEKQTHEETWDVAHQAGRFEGKGIAEENWQTFEQYYNETFKLE